MASDPNLTVPHGQVTFDAEGNDNPNSIYFTRVVHWPGGVSGVTIGRGYDFGHRGSQSLIESEFSKANIDIGPFRSAIGLQGNEAKAWVQTNKGNTPTITHQQQKDLFNFTYQSIKQDVIRLSSKSDVESTYGKTNFDTLNPKILDIVVDLRYRGDYTPKSRKRVQPCMVNNDLPTFTTLMQDRDYWSAVPADRFKRRVQFLLAESNTASTATTSPTTSGTADAPSTTATNGTPAQPVIEIAKPKTYTVQPGDSLWKISRKFDVGIDSLKWENRFKLKQWGKVVGFNAGEVISIP